MAEFGENLREARQRKGITQQTVADQIFVSRQAVSQWESGARYPDLLTAKKLSEYLDVPLDHLLSAEQLEEYPECSPIIETAHMTGIQTSLYTVLSVLYLIQSAFAIYATNATAIPRTAMVISAVQMIFFLVMTGFSVLGTALAIKGKLTPDWQVG